MVVDGAAGISDSRRRIVMLVDNGVTGDSRVQKVARSAAEAGWDVILLGCSPTGQSQTWQLGQAEVRLVPFPQPLAKKRHEFRRVFRRGPLAYPPSGIAEHRAQWVRAWQADLRVRAAQLAIAKRTGGPVPPGGARRLRLEERAAAVLKKWVSFRYWQLTSAQRARRRLEGPIDRFYTWFWPAVQGDRSWRRLEPGLWDYELAFGPVIDELAPDLIHAHDYRMVGVGARATVRARAAGRDVKLVWDAHEFLPGLSSATKRGRWLKAHVAHEREYAPFADEVLTVSEGLAELLRESHGLAEMPTVVMNAPDVTVRDRSTESGADEPVTDIRTRCGLGPETPLLAYSGGIAPVRGVDVMIDALPTLTDVHVALVSVPPGKRSTASIDKLLDRAAKLGVADRVHLLPYVPHWQVSEFLSTANAAVSPLVHLTNHEIALSNKFFEYSQARLPMVVSDVRTMAATVRSTGQGEVFRAQDVQDYIRAVRAVLADPARYRAAYDRPGLLESWTWEAQARVLEGVYRRLLPGPPLTVQPDVPGHLVTTGTQRTLETTG
ncbi:glycosyltransferase family 4 protein [Plantactinospora veratri]|uniref:Glycosyltransferase family 4 protein n=1 Tax=Plantactinospora veratri TaxID=1436122 RepID=A0ABU7SPQ2_9ACTN